MHEASLCRSLLRIAEEELARAGGARITALRVAVGDWSGVAPQALEAVFPICAQGSAASGAQLRIERCAGRGLVLRDMEVI